MRIKITDIATGKTILHQWFEKLEHVWFSVEPACVEFYGCPAEDVHCGEAPDGTETIEINGVPVASLEYVYQRNSGALAIFTERAA